MEENQHPIVLVLSPEQAEMMNAALARYRLYLVRHEDPEIRQIIPHAEELQRYLVEEAQRHTIPPIDAQAIAMLSQMNHVRMRQDNEESEEARASRQVYAYAHTWLTVGHGILVYSGKDDRWHFGREMPQPAEMPKFGPESQI